jgi:hypothetical protein
MSELKTAVLREILFAHATRSVSNTLYEQIIVRGKLDDKLADIGPRISAILGCDDPSTANEELIAAVMAKMETTMQLGFEQANQKMVECKDEIKSDIAAVDEKVSKLKCRGKRRGKYDDETTEFCVALLSAAEHNETIKSGLTTRVTHSAVFEYNRRELEQRGVCDVAEFSRIIRAHQAKMQRRRSKEQEERQKQTAAENGIIRGMAKTTTWQRNS